MPVTYPSDGYVPIRVEYTIDSGQSSQFVIAMDTYNSPAVFPVWNEALEEGVARIVEVMKAAYPSPGVVVYRRIIGNTEIAEWTPPSQGG